MIQNIIEKIRQDKKLLIVMMIGLVGAVMLIFAGSEPEKKANANQIIEDKSAEVVNSTADIEKLLEDKLISIVSQVKGAGKISAVVTVGSSGEYVYAENYREENDDGSVSKDSEIVIYESQDGVDSGLIISKKNPDITGVAIVCEGGDSSVIKAEITNLVTSLFGIGYDRVYVGSKAVN